MVRLSRLLLVMVFLFVASGALAQTIQGPLETQNSLSEINSNGTQSTARTNIGAAASGANSDITSLIGITTPIPGSEGGTGIANTGFTITLGGNLTTSGAYASTFTMTGTTTVTFPTAGTLLTTTGNGSGLTGLTYSQLPALSANQLLGSLTATTPSGQSVPSCSTTSSALDWTSGSGFTCNTAVNAAQLTGNTWAVPGTIGSTTANTGAFTTLSASSTVSGSGFSTYLASPPAIGGTAAAAGSFTTLSASSTVSGSGFSTYLASPPAIGGTAAAAGSFTTLSASSTVSGSGFSTYLASPPAIGGTAAASGKFTTLTATSTITPSTTSGIVGTTAADNANAGSVGEILSNSTSAFGLTSTVVANATSVSLTAGDWDLTCSASIIGAATTTISALGVAVNTTSAAFPSTRAGAIFQMSGLSSLNYEEDIFTPPVRENISSTTTVYCPVFAQFSGGTATAAGYVQARRVR